MEVYRASYGQEKVYICFRFGGVAGADGAWLRRPLLEAVLNKPPLVPLLDELKMQGDHLLLQLGDGGFQYGDVGEQLLSLQKQ